MRILQFKTEGTFLRLFIILTRQIIDPFNKNCTLTRNDEKKKRVFLEHEKFFFFLDRAREKSVLFFFFFYTPSKNIIIQNPIMSA